MRGEQYTVMFSGEIQPGQQIETVKNNIAALFKLPVEKCEYLFTGNPVTIKTNLDYQAALKYQKAFEQRGAVCQIKPSEAQTRNAPPEAHSQNTPPNKTSKKFTVKPYLLNAFTRSEKIAILKLLIKVADADNVITEEENAKIQEFLHVSHLKISQEFLRTVREEKIPEIVSDFTNRSSLKRASALIENYANYQGINPEFEGKVLGEIAHAIDEQKKATKFSLVYWIKAFFYGFSFLWGQEDINPVVKKVLALLFTIAACIFGSFWTSSVSERFLGLSLPFFTKVAQQTHFVTPQFVAVITGLFIYGALSVRNYMPRPTNFTNIVMICVNVYLLSLVSTHILGRSEVEKTMTFVIFFGLIVLLWLGVKEIMGFFLIGVFVLMIYKIHSVDLHFDWRAYPFVICTFMGLSFQSENFFDDFQNISRSYIKPSAIERELMKESLS
ncbi:hypothetical protein U27_06972 [Candidatus Vecturithrix granuli]|uniref:Uncharacterized protein n=1 Tax=Vecturithrix granuli TaxID=1499967 RepID=A0A081C5Y0_VECG1|nr:hypothetical protein U27_06972 [Candidatus Vecturithrix granuli]